MNKIRFVVVALCCGLSIDATAIDNGTDWMYLPGIGIDIPSARANALGGAFVGIADDLSANIINPAGLSLSDKSRFVATVKYNNWDRYPGNSTANAGFFEYDAGDDFLFSYLAYATPVFNKRAYISAFFHQQHMANNYAFRGLIVESNAKMTMRDYGIGLAIPLLDKRASVGLAISYTDLDVDSQLSTVLGTDTQHQGFSDEATIRLGGLLHINSALTLGVSANFMPKFKYQTQYSGTNLVLIPSGINDCTTTATQTTCSNSLSLPDTYSIGLAYRPSDDWLISLEGKYVQYSQLLDDFRVIYQYDSANISQANYHLDDAWQLHIGAEYRLQTAGLPIALRLGYYNEDYHGITVSGAGSGETDRLVFDDRSDIHHWTFGFGTNFSEQFSLDFAVDYAEEKYQLLLTTGFSY